MKEDNGSIFYRFGSERSIWRELQLDHSSGVLISDLKIMIAQETSLMREFARKTNLLISLYDENRPDELLPLDDNVVVHNGSRLIINRVAWTPSKPIVHIAKSYIDNEVVEDKRRLKRLPISLICQLCHKPMNHPFLVKCSAKCGCSGCRECLQECLGEKLPDYSYETDSGPDAMEAYELEARKACPFCGHGFVSACLRNRKMETLLIGINVDDFEVPDNIQFYFISNLNLDPTVKYPSHFIINADADFMNLIIEKTLIPVYGESLLDANVPKFVLSHNKNEQEGMEIDSTTLDEQMDESIETGNDNSDEISEESKEDVAPKIENGTVKVKLEDPDQGSISPVPTKVENTDDTVDMKSEYGETLVEDGNQESDAQQTENPNVPVESRRPETLALLLNYQSGTTTVTVSGIIKLTEEFPDEEFLNTTGARTALRFEWVKRKDPPISVSIHKYSLFSMLGAKKYHNVKLNANSEVLWRYKGSKIIEVALQTNAFNSLIANVFGESAEGKDWLKMCFPNGPTPLYFSSKGEIVDNLESLKDDSVDLKNPYSGYVALLPFLSRSQFDQLRRIQRNTKEAFLMELTKNVILTTPPDKGRVIIERANKTVWNSHIDYNIENDSE